MKFSLFQIVFLLFAVWLPRDHAMAQETDSVRIAPSVRTRYSLERLLFKADSCRAVYDFPSAVEFSTRALEATDSVKRGRAEEQLILSQNGLRMMDYCSQPIVIARQRFSLEDFFLFYPLPDRSWRSLPNPLDSLRDAGLSRATYVPEDAEEIYYSARDAEGIRNIYRTRLADSLWTVPTLINESLTSASDEIFPMLSPDGESLYFSSKGLYGMGGYDLYVSRWNPQTRDWEVPTNMGFPYSSPYDDFLFLNTGDGAYSIFASNRDCSRDSVMIYVLEYDGMPVRKAVGDVRELRKLAALEPAGDPARMDNSAAVSGANLQNEDIQRYMDKMKEVRMIRDSVNRFSTDLDTLRAALVSAPEEERAALIQTISDRETLLPALNDSLSRAVRAIQAIEMDFLVKGIVLDADKLQADADKEVVGAASGYAFSKKNFGDPLRMDFNKPAPSFDYTFKILPEGRFALDNTLPGGLVYQIQLFTVSREVSLADLRGLSPVFKHPRSSGAYAYSVGVFRLYQDVLDNLNKVKRLGFRDAFITAYNNGTSISVRDARAMESRIRILYSVKIFPDDGHSLSEPALAAIRRYPDIDLVRSTEAGSVVFLVESFEEIAAAEALVAALKATGVAHATIHESMANLAR